MSGRECVLVRHPRHGEYAFGFITGQTQLSTPEGDLDLFAVYIPTNHVYVGDIFLLSAADIIRNNLSVREGIGGREEGGRDTGEHGAGAASMDKARGALLAGPAQMQAFSRLDAVGSACSRRSERRRRSRAPSPNAAPATTRAQRLWCRWAWRCRLASKH